ncbi:MAG: AsmA family protein, partial [Alphaproteobacteria bacterium]|nr:AsmA family protein [Alphaproteobacteria bacterium]
MRWWWQLILGIIGLVILAMVVGTVLLSLQDANKFKDIIARKVSEKTGRELTIAGNFDLSISFSPSLTAGDVTFENAAWGSRPEMLKLGHVEAKVALFPILGGNLEIERLILDDMDLLAETNEDGIGNWVFGDRKTADDGDDGDGELPVIEDLRINNALLRYRDGRTGERHVVMIARAEAGAGEASGGDFTLEGVWNNSPIDANGTIGPGNENVAVALFNEMIGAKTEITGTVGELDELEGLALHVRVSGEKLSDLNMIA